MRVILLARKSLTTVLFETVLCSNTGSIDIDGCRVSTKGSQENFVRKASGIGYSPGSTETDVSSEILEQRQITKDITAQKATDLGRWPSNVILEHNVMCRCSGTQFIRPLEGHRPNPVRVQSDGEIQFNSKLAGYQKISYTNNKGLEAVPKWECVSECAVQELDTQGIFLNIHSTGNKGISHMTVSNSIYGKYKPFDHNPNTYGDTGTVSRFYKQFIKCE